MTNKTIGMFLSSSDRRSLMLSHPNKNSTLVLYSWNRRLINNDIIKAVISSRQDLTLATPYDTPNSNHVGFVDYVLEKLKECNSISVDITDGNFNVIFELGLGIGLGVPVFQYSTISIETETDSRDHCIPPLIQDIRQSRPKNITNLKDALIKYILENKTRNRLLTQTSPYRLFNSHISSLVDIRLWASSPSSTLAAECERIINENCGSLDSVTEFGLAVDHPNARSTFLHIANSDVNIFCLDPGDNYNARKINTNMCLLAGYSYGLGKRTLFIIPQSKSGKFSDFRQNSIVVSNSESLANPLKLFLKQLQSSKSQVVVRQFIPINEPTVYDDPTKISNVGQQHAEDDHLLYKLQDELVPNGELEQYRKLPIIVGEKGSGKTALCKIIANKFSEIHQRNVIYIDSADRDIYQLESLLNSSDDSDRAYELRKRNLSRSLWAYIVPVYLANNCLQYSDILPPNLVSEINQLPEKLDRLFGSKGIVWSIAATFNEFYDSWNPEADESAHLELLGAFKYVHNNSISILEKLKNKGFHHCVVIDSMDGLYNVKSAKSLSFLLGLLDYSVSLGTNSDRVYDVILSVRRDLYSKFKKTYREPDKIGERNLIWDANGLEKVLRSRLAVQLSSTRLVPESILHTYFVATDKRYKILRDMMIDNIRLVPREAIMFFNNCREYALRNVDNERIDLVLINRVAIRMSKDRCSTIRSEYGYLAPWISSVFDVIKGIAIEYIDHEERKVEFPREILFRKLLGIAGGLDVYNDDAVLIEKSSQKCHQILSDLMDFGILSPKPRSKTLLVMSRLYFLGLIHSESDDLYLY